jgi:RimJ/RimL family protein N-acetyltransferase
MSSQQKLTLRSGVKLVPLSLQHAPNMYRWVSDPIVADNIGLRSEPSLEKTEDWIQRSLDDPLSLAFAIMLEDQHVGTLLFDRYDAYLGTIRLGINYIGEATARGVGVGLTSLYLGYSAAFANFPIHKVWITVHSQNFRNLSALTRLGVRLEGLLRNEFILKDQLIDLVYLGLLREDFEKIEVTFSL